jgi:hypothetical protein
MVDPDLPVYHCSSSLSFRKPVPQDFGKGWGEVEDAMPPPKPVPDAPKNIDRK